ncbi:YgdI/YgdR family lipoprotein [Citrobacter sp. RHBSTW-00678]|uniref:Lipoprotein YgdI/YgdR-like SH3-like domain-containing protein n=1 Tax=Citrobacter braakii TaxID=57706 RepID=A0AAD1L4X9_CITBR|nr:MULTISPECIES: YgdI/YgdR family lipoprotein [Citrobacter]AUV24802.1 YgdI/YgdR family lipoprotein [Citrobacter freundii complex sp. CFNIH3]MBA7757101.1 YgdI/YgdR family lipoprotein [Citrobacter sp. RHBSTW-00325]MBA8059896.1 YgdI/YgdR family lipoprotein [Citrobacter sp. RHBSTW-00104]POV72888.1 YgdI/YgdR family lipoprotein [Citrobacter freundii complex sp. CFNIH5]QLR64286.1 YgdI/YgdR family lipoprotein [Citrobacter sp. RHBSTW-00976]
MQKHILITSIFTAAALFTVAGCSSNQAVKTTDGKTIVTDGKPQIDDDTGLVSYKNAQTGKTEQINRDQVKDMSELDN